MKRRVILAAKRAALTCGGSLRAHHSISAIDTSTPVWAWHSLVEEFKRLIEELDHER